MSSASSGSYSKVVVPQPFSRMAALRCALPAKISRKQWLEELRAACRSGSQAASRPRRPRASGRASS
eukprot:4946572-Alexandrium_andersonii.AAC.1